MPSKYESFGLVALEALATGTPVIASRVGGLATIVQDTKTGFLIPWQCPDAFARKLEILLANESILEAMAVEARKSARVYSWSSVGEELSKLYASSVLQRVGSALLRDGSLSCSLKCGPIFAVVLVAAYLSLYPWVSLMLWDHLHLIFWMSC